MEYDEEKVDEVTLALMWVVLHDESSYGARVWKGFDWETLDRLHKKGIIGDPASKAKSVTMSTESVELARSLFEKHFGVTNSKTP